MCECESGEPAYILGLDRDSAESKFNTAVTDFTDKTLDRKSVV